MHPPLPAPPRALILTIVLTLSAAVSVGFLPASETLREGDIIFQETNSSQGKALKLALGSRYTHVGILFKRRGAWQVLEAVQPVKYTTLRGFLRRGTGKHYVIKRLKESDRLTPEVIAAMKRQGASYLGRNYDLYFHWSDNRIYCSELIWKLYKEQTGLELGKLEKLGSFDLSHPVVRRKLRERYGAWTGCPRNGSAHGGPKATGNNICDEPVIPPSTMFASEYLITVAVYP